MYDEIDFQKKVNNTKYKINEYQKNKELEEIGKKKKLQELTEHIADQYLDIIYKRIEDVILNNNDEIVKNINEKGYYVLLVLDWCDMRFEEIETIFNFFCIPCTTIRRNKIINCETKYGGMSDIYFNVQKIVKDKYEDKYDLGLKLIFDHVIKLK